MAHTHDKRLRVLVIEDQPADFALLKRQLAKSGLDGDFHRVDDARSLRAALDDTAWDVVLSDYCLPSMGFEQVMHLLKSRRPDLPLIIVSGSLGEERAIELLHQGASDYVIKDRPERLPHAMRRVLAEAAEQRNWQAMSAALQISEERLRYAMKGTRDGIWDWNLHTDEVYLSTGWKTMLGYDEQELPDHVDTWKWLCHPDDVDATNREVDAFLRGRSDQFETRFRLRHKNGTYRLILSRGFMVRDALGAPARLVGVHTDLTDITHAEERLRLGAIVFENTRDGVVVTDSDGVILAINPAFTHITGYSETEAIGHPMSIMRSGRHDRGFYTRLWKSVATNGTWQGEIWNRRRNGEIFPEWLTISAVQQEHGRARYVGVFSDLSGQHDARRLEELAHKDPLTGLPNRLVLESQLAQALERHRRSNTRGAVLFLDLDRFKPVNDTHGHLAGDDLLRQVAHRLRERLRGVDTLARLGGDEFVIVLNDLTNDTDALQVAQTLVRDLERPFVLPSGAEVNIGASVGVAPFTNGTPDDHLRQADAALYEAKAQGRGRVTMSRR